WTFHWAGREHSKEVYLSRNVEVCGRLNGGALFKFMAEAGLFLLSSVDDPFPLACMEASMAYERVVVYRGSGISEVVERIAGAAIYEKHTPESAFYALKRAVKSDLDVKGYKNLNRLFSVKSFADRFNGAINSVFNEERSNLHPLRLRLTPRV